ncbi:hypothetical protein HDV06_001869 [Boothiomyces sp. JEL0866]|nr:hypothetical protein HDV06_001869 [Boothiomyces sp. JEL0866]
MKTEIFNKDKKEILEILSTIDVIIKKTGKKDLDHYNKWFNAYPSTLNKKNEKVMSKEELITIVHWKLLNGTFRPGFIKRVEKNTQEMIAECSKAAFQIIETSANADPKDSVEASTLFGESDIVSLDIDVVKRAINELTKLHGIGVATATAVLSCVYDFIPFMSDQALYATVAKQKYRYTFPEYQALYNTIVEEARHIGVTPRELERAIWCNDVGNKQKEKIEKKYKRKPETLESANKKK